MHASALQLVHAAIYQTGHTSTLPMLLHHTWSPHLVHFSRLNHIIWIISYILKKALTVSIIMYLMILYCYWRSYIVYHNAHIVGHGVRPLGLRRKFNIKQPLDGQGASSDEEEGSKRIELSPEKSSSLIITEMPLHKSKLKGRIECGLHLMLLAYTYNRNLFWCVWRKHYKKSSVHTCR